MKNKKKDLLQKAAQEDLNPESGSEINDFVNNMKRDKASSEENIKNDLPHHKEEKEKDSNMESRLKKLTSSTIQPAAFEDEEPPPRWKKNGLWVAAGILALLLLYFILFSSTAKPIVYLSNSPIEDTTIRALSTTNLSFAKGKPLYIYFSSGARIGQEKLIVKVTELYADSSNMVKEESIGQAEASVKPNWKNFSTYFQRENFDHTGRFRVHIIAPTGDVLASQDFKIH